MATEFSDKTAVISDLKSRFGNENVGVEKNILTNHPYGELNGGNWTENPNCPFRLYRVFVSDQSGINETSREFQQDFIERKADGKCWYRGSTPRQQATSGTFQDDVLDYFKQYTPGVAVVPCIVAIREYLDGSKESSSALIAGIKKTGLSASFYVVYYDGGSLTHGEVTYAEAQKFVEIQRGL